MEIITVDICDLDYVLVRVNLSLTLNYIVVKKTCPLKFVRISHTLTDMNGMKSNEGTQVPLSGILGLGEILN